MLTPTFVIMVPVVSVFIEPFIYFCLFFYSVSFSGLGVRRRFGSSGPVLIINNKGDNN